MATGNLLAIMMQSSLIVVLLSIFGGVESQEIGNCYDDLTVLYNDLQSADLLAQKTYTLCPNTVFEVGASSLFGECCSDGGQNPLVARPNTRFQCGEDGKSENGCVLRGGTFQFQSTFSSSSVGTPNENVQVSGITFETAVNVGLILSQAGDVTFTDCIIRAHQNSSPVTISYTASSRRGLKQQSKDIGYLDISETGKQSRLELSKDDNERYLQATRQSIVFDGCLFEGNKQGVNGDEQVGVMSIISTASDVVIKNSTFRENVFADTQRNTGYAAANFIFGSTLTIENTCFIDNDFIGSGPVQTFNDAEITTQGNYGTFDDNLLCQFVVKTPGFASTVEDKTCVDYDEESCTNNMDDSLMLSSAPSFTPSSTPSSVVTVPPTTSPSRIPSDVPTVALATSTPVSTGGDDGGEELTGDESTGEEPTASPVNVNRPTQVTDATAGESTATATGGELLRMTVLVSSAILGFLY